ncbi:terpene cyclase/mutase family protein [Bacillota bacterium LX-D]|nr:terpene cyclase/mutase family protein [Bacillota bacterium LX-D]
MMLKKNRLVNISLVVLSFFAFNCYAFAAPALWKQDYQVNITKGLQYLHSVQNKDGGFSPREGRPSDRTTTLWVMMALSSVGENVTSNNWKPKGQSPLDYVMKSKETLKTTCDYARLLLALTTAQQSTVYQGTNLVQKITSFQQKNGQFGQPAQQETGAINVHIWSILALASAGEKIPNQELAKQWLLDRQNKDGGFGWFEGVDSDADDTGAALQALTVLGENQSNSLAMQKAVTYLKTCQGKDGGFNSGWMGDKSNSATDAWVIQGLVAAGIDPAAKEWSVNGKNVLTHLLGLQKEKGFFSWTAETPSSKVLVTAYSLLALSGNPHPVNGGKYVDPVVKKSTVQKTVPKKGTK